MTDLDDLFTDDIADPQYGVRNGRYRFPAPPGEQESPDGWMRMTNLVSAFSDQKALEKWMTWKVMRGLRDHEVIFDEWMAEPLHNLSEKEERELAYAYAERAREAAKSDHGARRGTARHLMMETWFRESERTGTRSMQRQLESALEALDTCGFEVLDQEMLLWNPIVGGTMGKADARIMCRHTGQVGVLDWKTQQRFWTWQEICGQLTGYDTATWQWEGPQDDRGRWVRPADPDKRRPLKGHPDGPLAGRPIGIVAHMPQADGPEQLPVTLHEVDLVYGREVLETAARNVDLRSRGRAQSMARRPACLRLPA